jgi:metal-sulfur cluster biosynthetic enzyme
MTSVARVLDALCEVRDPELDEPITSLGLVNSCQVSAAGDVALRLRLPTPQCAPNFAFLMAADAQEAARRVPGVREVVVELEDHYTAREINAALARGGRFTDAFPGESDDDDLGALRSLFQRKALIARQARSCERLLANGLEPSVVCALPASELPDDPDARRCLELRKQLGLAHDEDSPAFVLPDGSPLAADQLRRWLRMAALVRTSLEVNGGVCRSLLQIRQKMAAADAQEVAT